MEELEWCESKSLKEQYNWSEYQYLSGDIYL